MSKTAVLSESCPTCQRILVTAYADGSFVLAGRASVSAVGVMIPRAIEGNPLGASFRGTPEPRTAVCDLWRCRLRRWWGAR